MLRFLLNGLPMPKNDWAGCICSDLSWGCNWFCCVCACTHRSSVRHKTERCPLIKKNICMMNMPFASPASCIPTPSTKIVMSTLKGPVKELLKPYWSQPRVEISSSLKSLFSVSNASQRRMGSPCWASVPSQGFLLPAHRDRSSLPLLIWLAHQGLRLYSFSGTSQLQK